MFRPTACGGRALARVKAAGTGGAARPSLFGRDRKPFRPQDRHHHHRCEGPIGVLVQIPENTLGNEPAFQIRAMGSAVRRKDPQLHTMCSKGAKSVSKDLSQQRRPVTSPRSPNSNSAQQDAVVRTADTLQNRKPNYRLRVAANQVAIGAFAQFRKMLIVLPSANLALVTVAPLDLHDDVDVTGGCVGENDHLPTLTDRTGAPQRLNPPIHGAAGFRKFGPVTSSPPSGPKARTSPSA